MSGDVCNMTSLHMKGSAEFHNMSNIDDNVMANECYNYHTLNVEEGEGGGGLKKQPAVLNLLRQMQSRKITLESSDLATKLISIIVWPYKKHMILE